jgi:hypothetical protein
MRRVIIAVGLVIFTFMFIGCASKQKVETAEAPVPTLITENTALRNRVAELEGKVEKVEANLKSDIDACKEENRNMRASISEMERKIEEKVSTPPPPSPEPQGVKEEKKAPEVKNGRIKVLSGTGDRHSATAMAAELKGLGYHVVRVGKAQKNDYKINTIYYATGFQSEAERLAKEINGEIKILSWKSAFDMIVVTGKSSN